MWTYLTILQLKDVSTRHASQRLSRDQHRCRHERNEEGNEHDGDMICLVYTGLLSMGSKMNITKWAFDAQPRGDGSRGGETSAF